jgi:hypothetical protein
MMRVGVCSLYIGKVMDMPLRRTPYSMVSTRSIKMVQRDTDLTRRTLDSAPAYEIDQGGHV